FFFFFQAEDGIRDKLVTGVQTCALPIWVHRFGLSHGRHGKRGSSEHRRRRLRQVARAPPSAVRRRPSSALVAPTGVAGPRLRRRSEERRVGKEWRARRATGVETKKEDNR